MTSIAMPYEIGTPEAQLQIAEATTVDYLSGNLRNAVKAQIAALLLHGMQDWTVQYRLVQFGYADGNIFRQSIYQTEPRLAVVRDFANVVKHGKFRKNSNRVLEKIHEAGSFSQAFSDGFDRARIEMHLLPGVLLPSGGYLTADDILKESLEFWKVLYQNGQLSSNSLESQPAQTQHEIDKQPIQLLDQIGDTASQLAIAEQLVEQSTVDNTPAMYYVAATVTAPLENWGYQDLKTPMEFPDKRSFRQYLHRDCPAIRATRQLARAAKSGARIISKAGLLTLVVSDGGQFGIAETLHTAVTKWRQLLAEYAHLG